MRVAITGSGAREHALTKVLGRTAEVVSTLPGNAFNRWSDPTDPLDFEADLFVIGPEKHLVNGLAEKLRAQGKLVLGPGRDGARLEGSKAWMKDILVKAGVPTARYGVFYPDSSRRNMRTWIERFHGQVVVKTSYLADGKGARVCGSTEEAYEDGLAKLQHGAVVIEEHLEPIAQLPEASVFALCNGREAVLLGTARDYKRLRDGDEGPNTGGMGAYSPVPEVDVELVMRTCVQPTIDELCSRGIDYRGILYFGLMFTTQGFAVLEINIRFGDPEAQVVMPRIKSDLAELFRQAAAGEAMTPVEFFDLVALTVVLATGRYPDFPGSGDDIQGLDAVARDADCELFFAGIQRGRLGQLQTNGGRVVSVTSLGGDLPRARAQAYRGVELIGWPGLQYRSDIGLLPMSAGAASVRDYMRPHERLSSQVSPL